ncbi:Eukaryotic translation initiation factor [Arachis hypogaea]|nr:Eukaryotic translation initiation factor [Arachis hypogaea]
MLRPATVVEATALLAGHLWRCSNFEATVVAATGLASFLYCATTVPPRRLCSTASALLSCSLSHSGSENGDTVNYATVEKMNALLEGLFDDVKKAFGKEATKRKNHLAGAVAGDDEGSQLLLLNAAEEFYYKKCSNELNEVALILKALYDVDLVEEEHVMHWYSKGLKGDKKDSQVWKNAQPFIDWLRNAESESEEG